MPVVALEHQHLDGRAGDGDLEERARLVAVDAVGVQEKGMDRDVDGLHAGVDEGDELLVAWHLRIFVYERLVRDMQLEHGLVGDEFVEDVRLCLLAAHQTGEGVGQRRWKALQVVHAAVQCERRRLDLNELAPVALERGVLVARRHLRGCGIRR